jgi:hypothetical protein
MEINRVFNLLILFFILLCISCGTNKNDSSKVVDQKLQYSKKLTGENENNILDGRIKQLNTLSFNEALNEEWGFIIDIVPIPGQTNVESYLGGIVRRNGIWVAGYDSEFASCELKKIVNLNENTVRFYVDIWRNADPERPFAPRQDNTPVYSFYVDLSATIFHEAVLRGINEKRQVVVIKLPAFDTSGNPVGEWYRK